MSRGILTLNVGSSSVKYALYQEDSLKDFESAQCLTRGIIELHPSRITHDVHSVSISDKIDQVLLEHSDIMVTAMVHRVVHGGQLYFDPIIIDDINFNELKNFIPLAPMHMTPELAAIDELSTRFPGIPQIACFDTAFHGNRPELDKRFALPKDLFQSGILRYGFHGLSYDYINRISQHLLDEDKRQNLIVAHLGNGASMSAIKNGQCLATSMGFSALDGLMMGSRCGAIDPGVLLYLLQEKHYEISDLNQLLHKQSGLLGVSGISHDIRELEMSDAPDAKLAMDLFAYRCAKELGALMMVMGDLDSIIFTGGIGENSATMRSKIINQLTYLHLNINTQHNHHNELKISDDQSPIDVYVIPTNEELMMAHQAYVLLTTTTARQAYA